jgi:hypothetical protein
MIGIPSLHEMVARELARRQEGDGKFPALCFIVNDEAGALTDVEAAVQTVIADAGARARDADAGHDRYGHAGSGPLHGRITIAPSTSIP